MKSCQYYIWSMATGKLDGLCGCDAVLGNYKLNTNKSGILCCWHPNHFANYMSSFMRYSLLQNYLLPQTYHLKREKECAAFKLSWHDLKSTAICHIAAMNKKVYLWLSMLLSNKIEEHSLNKYFNKILRSTVLLLFCLSCLPLVLTPKFLFSWGCGLKRLGICDFQ